MSKILKCAVFITLLSSSAMAEQFNLVNGEPEKIEFYGRDHAGPPVTIKLASGSKLCKQVKAILSDEEGWARFSFRGSKLPTIYVFGKDKAYLMDIEPGIIELSYENKQNRGTFRMKETNAEVYNEIEATILDLIEQKKRGASTTDEVVFPKDPEPYVPETVEDMIGEEIASDEFKKLLDYGAANEEKLKVIEHLFERVQNNPAYPESLKKELEKEKERLTDKYMGLAVKFKRHLSDVNLEELDEIYEPSIKRNEAVEDLRVTNPREQDAYIVLEGETDPARPAKSLGFWKYVVILLMLGASAIMISKRKR